MSTISSTKTLAWSRHQKRVISFLRKEGISMSDSTKISDGITVTILGIQNGVAQFGFEAPEKTTIVLTEDVKPGDPNRLGVDGRD